ncbi:hypothetical protein VUR80DRAFT_2034 [Thermomyces stellatus]
MQAVPGVRYVSQYTDASHALRSAAQRINARDERPRERRPRTPGPWRETRPSSGRKYQGPPRRYKDPVPPPHRGGPERNNAELAKQMAKCKYHGDEVLLEGQQPPEGYEFLHRDRFLIRHARALAKESNRKIYMLLTGHKDRQGYYAPADIIQQVRSRSEELQAKDRQRWWANLERHYPRMPEKDKAEIDKLCYSTFLALTARSPAFYYNHTIRLYVLDRYTDVKLRPPFAEDDQVIAEAHAKADEILMDWMRGSSGPPGGEPVSEE